MFTTEKDIESFIKEYLSARVVIESSLRAILNRAVGYERVFNKPFYEFTKEEALTMFKEAGSISATSLLNNCLVLKHASNYHFMTKGVKATNIYAAITKDDLKTVVNADKKSKMLITKEQLIDIQQNLLNYTDMAIVELLFRGIGSVDWAHELTFLDRKQISRTDMCIYFRNGKKVEIDERCYNILMQSAKEDELMSYNSSRVSKVMPDGIVYKIRHNAITNNDSVKDDGSKQRRFRWMQRRIQIINDFMGLNLTPTSISNSGLLHEIRKNMELNALPFRQYIATQEACELSQRYGIFSKHYAITLVEKYGSFFE